MTFWQTIGAVFVVLAGLQLAAVIWAFIWVYLLLPIVDRIRYRWHRPDRDHVSLKIR